MTLYALFALQAGGGGGLPGLVLFLPLILLFAYMFYSQQRKQKKWQSLLGGLKTGDKVITTGGMYGTIAGLEADAIQLRIAEQVKVKVSRSAIAGLQTEEKGS